MALSLHCNNHLQCPLIVLIHIFFCAAAKVSSSMSPNMTKDVISTYVQELSCALGLTVATRIDEVEA